MEKKMTITERERKRDKGFTTERDKKVRERKTVKYNRKTERDRQTDKEKERKKCVD